MVCGLGTVVAGAAVFLCCTPPNEKSGERALSSTEPAWMWNEVAFGEQDEMSSIIVQQRESERERASERPKSGREKCKAVC